MNASFSTFDSSRMFHNPLHQLLREERVPPKAPYKLLTRRPNRQIDEDSKSNIFEI